MSAEDLGTRELGQVRSQRLDEFLATLRLLHDPSTNLRIGIPALDKLLANNTTRFDPTNLSAIPALPIIEITSLGSKSGKTEFLYWIVANLVLGSDTQPTAKDVEQYQTESMEHPTGETADDAANHESADSTGDNDTDIETDITHDPTTEQQSHQDPTPSDAPRETHDPTTEQPEHQMPPPSTNLSREPRIAPTTIALLSTSPANIPRLSQILLHHLQTLRPTLPLSSARETVHTALSHIHIFQPTSLSSLIATISSLPTYFLDPKNRSAERKLGAIIIDSPSTYFWADKASTQGKAQQGQGQQAQGQGQSKFPALASTLKRISTTLSAPVIFSSQHLSSSSTTSDSAALRPQLPAPFSTLPTLRLVIFGNAIQGFSKDVDAETAVRYQEGRDKAVGEAGFRVRVNKWANEGRGDGGGSGNAEGFEVRIDGKGVTVL